MAGHERGELLWTPSEEARERTTLTRYMRWLQDARGLGFDDYEELWRWSVDDLEGFWGSIWDFFDVKAAKPYGRVLTDRRMPGAKWFPGAELNYAEHVFRDLEPEALAMRARSESRGDSEHTWGELRDVVCRLRAGLAELGVGRGDRVVAYMPNGPETVAALLATASLGAIWSSAAPEFGARSVIDRFAQIEPKVLLTIDGYRYGGREFDRREKVEWIHAAMPDARLIRFGYLDGSGWSDVFKLVPGTD